MRHHRFEGLISMLQRKNSSLFVLGMSLTLILTSDAVAQRGGGRDGGDRGGGERGGPRREGIPREGVPGVNRPGEVGNNFDRSQLNRDGLNRPGSGAGDRGGAATRSELENFLNRGGAGDRAAAGKLIGPEAVKGIENRGPQRLGDADRGDFKNQVSERGDRVRGELDKNYPRWNFWGDHPDWASYRWNRPYRWATWGALGDWFGWTVPYIDYLYGDNLYYDDGNVYYNGTEVATGTEYAQQAEEYAQVGQTALKTKDENTEWMSLGVFALVHEKNEAPHMFFQLSVDNAGVIAGTYHDSKTGATKNVHGLVAKKSQRACWSVEGKPDNVVETGIYNLTQNQTECLMHFGTEHTQTWLLVRMEEPQGKAAEGNQPG